MRTGHAAGTARRAGGVARQAVGLALAQGWLPMVAVGTSAYAAQRDLGHALAPLWAGFAVGMCVSLALALAADGCQSAARSRAISPLAGLAAATFGYLLMIVTYSASTSGDGDWLVGLVATIAWSLVGLGSGALLCAWSAAIPPAGAGGRDGDARRDGRADDDGAAGGEIGLGACIGTWAGAVATCAALLPLFGALGHSVWASLVGAMLTAGSHALLRLDRASAGRDSSPRAETTPDDASAPAPAAGGRTTLPRRLPVVGIALGLSLSLMLAQFFGAPFARVLPQTWAFCLVGVSVIVVVQLALRHVRGAWRPLDACWACAAAIVVAFYPIDPGSAFSLHYAAAAAALACAMTLATLAPSVAQSALASGRDPWRCQLLAALGLVVGVAMGGPVGLRIASGPFGSAAIYPSAIATMILGFVTLALLIRPEGGRAAAIARQAGGAGVPDAHATVSPDDAIAAACAEVARRGGLTARELDVLVILAHGHGARRVQEELGVSEGTALTHRRHIYEKLGIHTRGELLDLVEHTERKGTAR